MRRRRANLRISASIFKTTIDSALMRPHERGEPDLPLLSCFCAGRRAATARRQPIAPAARGRPFLPWSRPLVSRLYSARTSSRDQRTFIGHSVTLWMHRSHSVSRSSGSAGQPQESPVGEPFFSTKAGPDRDHSGIRAAALSAASLAARISAASTSRRAHSSNSFSSTAFAGDQVGRDGDGSAGAASAGDAPAAKAEDATAEVIAPDMNDRLVLSMDRHLRLPARLDEIAHRQRRRLA